MTRAGQVSQELIGPVGGGVVANDNGETVFGQPPGDS
jgi:hypothetical protein